MGLRTTYRRLASPTSATTIPAFAAGSRPRVHTTATPRARPSTTRRRWTVSASWPSRRPGPTSGSAPIRAATSRRPAATRGAQAVPLPPALARTSATSAKFTRMIAFAPGAAAHLRARVQADLRRRGLPREKVLAAVVRLLETHPDPRRQRGIRAAEQELRADDPARPACRRSSGSALRFAFRGKSGKTRQLGFNDRRLARDRAGLPGPARPGALPVPRRGRRAPRRRVGRRQRLPARGHRRATSRPRTSAPGPARLPLPGRWPTTPALPTTPPRQAPRQSCASRPWRACWATPPAVCRKAYIHPLVLEAYETGDLPLKPSANERAFELSVLKFLETGAGRQNL